MKVRAFIQKHGVTSCPARAAKGTDYYKPTAGGYAAPESFEFSPSRESPSSALAKAKILTMIQDLGGAGISNAGEKVKLKNDAYRFFFSQKERAEFENWCDDAGFEPEYIREQARDIYENGPRKWRAEPGTGPSYGKRKQRRLLIKQQVVQ